MRHTQNVLQSFLFAAFALSAMVWGDDLPWVSYYSSHEEKMSVYLAKVKFR